MQTSGQQWYERLKGPGKMSIDMQATTKPARLIDAGNCI